MGCTGGPTCSLSRRPGAAGSLGGITAPSSTAPLVVPTGGRTSPDVDVHGPAASLANPDSPALGGLRRRSVARGDVGGLPGDVAAPGRAPNGRIVGTAPMTADDLERPPGQSSDAFQDVDQLRRRPVVVAGLMVSELANREVGREITDGDHDPYGPAEGRMRATGATQCSGRPGPGWQRRGSARSTARRQRRSRRR